MGFVRLHSNRFPAPDQSHDRFSHSLKVLHTLYPYLRGSRGLAWLSGCLYLEGSYSQWPWNRTLGYVYVGYPVVRNNACVPEPDTSSPGHLIPCKAVLHWFVELGNPVQGKRIIDMIIKEKNAAINVNWWIMIAVGGNTIRKSRKRSIGAKYM